jgi:probable rRNA maturation factor
VHGVLHLCGYKDKSIDESFVMRKKEDYYLNMYEGST